MALKVVGLRRECDHRFLDMVRDYREPELLTQYDEKSMNIQGAIKGSSGGTSLL